MHPPTSKTEWNSRCFKSLCRTKPCSAFQTSGPRLTVGPIEPDRNIDDRPGVVDCLSFNTQSFQELSTLCLATAPALMTHQYTSFSIDTHLLVGVSILKGLSARTPKEQRPRSLHSTHRLPAHAHVGRNAGRSVDIGDGVGAG